MNQKTAHPPMAASASTSLPPANQRNAPTGGTAAPAARAASRKTTSGRRDPASSAKPKPAR